VASTKVQAELSGNDGEDLDDYGNADEFVNIRADGSIGWHTTKAAPKIFVNCDMHNAFMVAAEPAGSSTESSSNSAGRKKNRRPKTRKKVRERGLEDDSGSGLVSAQQSDFARLASSDQQGLQDQQGLSSQQGLPDQQGLPESSDDDGPPGLIDLVDVFPDLRSAVASGFKPDTTVVSAPSMQAPRPGASDQQGRDGQQGDGKERVKRGCASTALSAMMAQIKQVPCARTGSAMPLPVNKIGGVSGFTKSLAALDKAKTVPVTPEPKGAFDGLLARHAHATPPQKEAVSRLQGYGGHALHVHGRQATWRARAEFDVNKLGCNAVLCVNDRPSALFRCPVDKDTGIIAFKGAAVPSLCR
jgi:hypothetical protein